MKRLEQQTRFIVEIDKLKEVYRQTYLMDRSRKENSAEHSWHLAVMVMILSEHARGRDLDVGRVMRMVLIHDLVEIDAGDAIVYDTQAREDKKAVELAAAERIFNLLPGGQAAEHGEADPRHPDEHRGLPGCLSAGAGPVCR